MNSCELTVVRIVSEDYVTQEDVKHTIINNYECIDYNRNVYEK